MKLLITALLAPALAAALCPMQGHLPSGHPPVALRPHPAPVGYSAALQALDFSAVKDDIVKLLTQSQEAWPADYGNYGPLFVRLAWHTAGSYRTSDGRGGAEGGRQRFDPERSWDDNTNLDKARSLLQPIKLKYGLGLSWGDLTQLAGYVALESMGTPLLGFCAGRVDDPDGSQSIVLGPTAEQEAFSPCEKQGGCKAPFGSTTIGLIYVNPEGPFAQPTPEASAVNIRDTFKRMAMNDSETVALIGGGHAFGKTHGACPDGAGPSPKEDPANPWPGKCGSGKGVDAVTSGIEGPWTTKPTVWDNEYFQNLVNHEWEVHRGPGGKWQWHVVNGTNPRAPAADGHGTQDTMMMTTDVSLTKDGAYSKIVQRFAADEASFSDAFAHAWYKLTTRDMGPAERCAGPWVPPAQPFQYPLPTPAQEMANFSDVKASIADILYQSPESQSEFVRLAYRCASTFRQTDYLGGCNGARIRFNLDWPVHQGLDRVLSKLDKVKQAFDGALSWADLIVLAGNTAVEAAAGGKPIKFCGGRADASTDDEGWGYLRPKVTGRFEDSLKDFRDAMRVTGFSDREWTALIGGVHSLSGAPPGYDGVPSPSLTNEYFTTLLESEWEVATSKSGKKQYRAKGAADAFALSTDLMLRWDAEYLAVAQDFASADNADFVAAFGDAWSKLMNADRFDGSAGNLCDA